MDAGIDYGLGQVNIDKETGIRYGVIHQTYVGQAWYDSSEPHYGDYECGCGEVYSEDGTTWPNECPCGQSLYDVYDFAEPMSFSYDKDGYLCECSTDGDIFVMKSPYFTYAQLCSPCAPGACHLGNPLERGFAVGIGYMPPPEDNRAYCFGHDWFEDGKAPYKVYSIATGEEV